MAVDLAVIRIDTRDGNRIRPQLGDRPQKITGAAKLVQEITRLLLTTPGTITDKPGQGAGLRSILRRLASRGNIDATRVDIITRINDVAEQVRQNQSEAELEPDETLDRLQILTVQFVDKRWVVRVRVRTLGAAVIADFGKIVLPPGTDLFGG